MKHNIHIRPLITEKTLNLVTLGWYTFKTDRFNRKPEVSKAIEKLYSVNVIDIRSVIMKGKTRRTGKKMIKITKTNWKKVLVKIKKDQRIDAFEITENTQKST